MILLGRLTRDPELRYSQGANPVAVANYSLAVRRQYQKEGQTDVDFINIVSFGKAGEFADKFFQKGQMVSVVGRLQIGNWEDKNGTKRLNVDVVAEEQHFAESKASFEGNKSAKGKSDNYEPSNQDAGFKPVNQQEEEDLPF